jgi:glycerol-3-phosphate dehydrogenase subunit C
MAITYDPKHPKYLDEADVRDELTRVFDICQDCRKCVDLCPSFPTLFGFLDRHDDRDAGRLTPEQQDHVVDACHQCKLCSSHCPYTPELDERALDFPRLMLRHSAMRVANDQVTLRKRITTSVLGHTNLVGTVALAMPVLSHRLVNAQPGSIVRKVMKMTTGVSAVRLLPPFAKERFSTWFKKRVPVVLSKKQGSVTVFPTCIVEYQQPSIGHDLVKVYERNGIECSLADGAGCCGAPYLHSGEVDEFTKVAAKQVKALADAVRRGNDIVVPQPTCGYVIKKDYVVYVGGPDAELVAAHTFDTSEYLINLHQASGVELDTDFSGDTAASISYHLPSHLKAQNNGMGSRDLVALTGVEITVIAQSSGVDGMWGYRAENDELSIPIAQKLADSITATGCAVVVGDCHLANTAIAELTTQSPLHPMQFLARAYGIAEEPTA